MQLSEIRSKLDKLSLIVPMNPMLSSPSSKSRLGVRRAILAGERAMSIIALFVTDEIVPSLPATKNEIEKSKN